MTREEVQKLVFAAVANFPSYQERDMGPTCELWFRMLKDLPYKLAEMALYKVLATAKFFPTVADIREAAAEIQNPGILSSTEAWGLVVQAIRNYGYYREGEALASLPPEVVQVVRCFGWRELCICEEPDIIRGQFRKAYENQMMRQKELAVLPEEIRHLLAPSGQKMRLIENV